MTYPRRRITMLAVGAIAVVSAACGSASGVASPSSSGRVPAFGSSPVNLDILDVAGNLTLTKGAIQQYQSTHSNRVGQITYTTATAPSLQGTLEPQEQSGQVSVDLVLTGTDGLSTGITNHLWQSMEPNYSAKFGTNAQLQQEYQTGAWNMQKLAQNQCLDVVYYPSGPLLEYNPNASSLAGGVPSTPQALLAWAQAHPGRFEYAEPDNSGPGRTFLMGLPYLLGDSNPQNPQSGWSNTWSYLAQLGKYVKLYETGTTATMKDLANGTVDMIMTTTGWDIQPRAIGEVPAGDQVAKFDNMKWVTDAQYMCVPKGLPSTTMAAVLDLMKYMLTPAAQAYTYDDGYFYPGPAIKNVPISMAPASSQQVIAQYGRSEYDVWIPEYPTEVPLSAANLTYAFNKWNQDIAGQHSYTG